MKIWTITYQDVDASDKPIGHEKTVTFIGSLSRWLFNKKTRAHFVAQTNRKV